MATASRYPGKDGLKPKANAETDEPEYHVYEDISQRHINDVSEHTNGDVRLNQLEVSHESLQGAGQPSGASEKGRGFRTWLRAHRFSVAGVLIVVCFAAITAYIVYREATSTASVQTLPNDQSAPSATSVNEQLTIKAGCPELMAKGEPSGVYTLSLPDGQSFSGFCDMDTAGGGWLVIQRRRDGSQNFKRPWVDYKNGFGNLSREFWLGNDKLAALTAVRQYVLRVDLADWNNTERYAEYNSFIVLSEEHKYRLISIGAYTGNAGDALKDRHVGQKFSTYDQENDSDDRPNRHCAALYHGGWWYGACHLANLNGEYNNTQRGEGINWNHWTGLSYSLRFTEMKIRPEH